MNPIKDPVKDTLVPLRTNFNTNGSVRWHTSLYLNLFHWPMGKNYGNGNGVCRYVRAVSTTNITWTDVIFNKEEFLKLIRYLVLLIFISVQLCIIAIIWSCLEGK